MKNNFFKNYEKVKKMKKKSKTRSQLPALLIKGWLTRRDLEKFRGFSLELQVQKNFRTGKKVEKTFRKKPKKPIFSFFHDFTFFMKNMIFHFFYVFGKTFFVYSTNYIFESFCVFGKIIFLTFIFIAFLMTLLVV